MAEQASPSPKSTQAETATRAARKTRTGEVVSSTNEQDDRRADSHARATPEVW